MSEQIHNDADRQDAGIALAELAAMPERTILDAQRLASLLGVAQRTLRRMVRRGELPQPVQFAGRACWTAGRVLGHFENAADVAEREARKEKERILRMTP